MEYGTKRRRNVALRDVRIKLHKSNVACSSEGFTSRAQVKRCSREGYTSNKAVNGRLCIMHGGIRRHAAHVQINMPEEECVLVLGMGQHSHTDDM
eukprot:scaffold18962_cov140-Skeletonema_marinoi.AAC.5